MERIKKYQKNRNGTNDMHKTNRTSSQYNFFRNCCLCHLCRSLFKSLSKSQIILKIIINLREIC
jgi:hypothetical protein